MSIQDGPNYFEDQFPFSAPPRLVFDGVEVQSRPTPDPHITDTTFRDGQQARAPYTPEQVRSLFDFLHRLSGERGLVRQSEFFLYSESDRRAVELCQERGYRFPEVTAWIRAQPGDFELARRSGVRETGILTSCSDYHIFRKLRLTRQEALARYLAVVDQALAAGITPRCHFEDVTRADLHGFVVPFASALRERAEQAGQRIKVRLCDTLGVATFHPGAAAPRSVQRIVAALRDDAGFAPENLEWHGHNDLGIGLANAVTAWRYGVGAVNGTLFGFGERTGNTPIEELIFEWMGPHGGERRRHACHHGGRRVLRARTWLQHAADDATRRSEQRADRGRYPCGRTSEGPGDLYALRQRCTARPPAGRAHNGQGRYCSPLSPPLQREEGNNVPAPDIAIF